MTRWTEADLSAFRQRQKGPEKLARSSAKTGPRSELEVQLEYQLMAHGLSGYVLQHRPLPPRKWALDFAWPETRLAIEVQGMVHRIKGKFKRDIEKRAELMLAGWRVLEVDGDAIRSGQAIAWAKILLAWPS